MKYAPRQKTDLAIVTSCHNYGRYLREWALSIVRLRTYFPAVVAIVDNGSTDTTPYEVAEAKAILEQAGIEVVAERMSFENFGAARNRAVEISGSTEWVMHFDADDVLMEHALEDFVALAPSADVVGAGYERSGDLKSGPRNRTRTYSAHRGKATLRSNAPCSGVSPFRRSFWERSPYRTDMRGGWDTALWIGFAHLDARFVPTRRPIFYYRQHADSVFNQRWPNERLTHFCGVKLGNLRRKISAGVAVVVPFRPDRAERDVAFDWVRRRYEALHPDWEFVVGDCPDGEQWRKGLAVEAALLKTKAATLVIADADVFVDPEALRQAVDAVQNQRSEWVVPHRKVKRLDRGSSEEVLGLDPAEVGTPERQVLARAEYEGYAGGGLVVVDRADYEASGGIPPVFYGWGAEDECLAVVLDTLLGLHTRLDFDLWHLWHSPARRMRHTSYRANRATLRLYLARLGDPDPMWELVRHVAMGGDPAALPTNSRVGTVVMVVIEKFQRGQEVLEPGDVFRASEEEARRHEVRARKIAKRANGSVLALRGQTNRERTLDIRAQQAERNEEAHRRLHARQELLRRGG